MQWCKEYQVFNLLSWNITWLFYVCDRPTGTSSTNTGVSRGPPPEVKAVFSPDGCSRKRMNNMFTILNPHCK